MRLLDAAPEIGDYLKKRPPKHAKQIALKFLDLMENVRPSDSKLMKGYVGIFEVTSGEYRIMYSYNPSSVKVLLIGPRNDDKVFHQLERKYRNLVLVP